MYDTFITQVIENKLLFTLKKNEEQAVCSSNDFIIEQTGEALAVFPFWSHKSLAESCKKEEWKSYQVSEIPLSEFIEFWCLEMYEDSIVAGINFDENLYGQEENPMELLKKIINEIEKSDTKITFKNFKSIKHLKNYLETEE
ncbi:DUF2750 domain-containing protein [Capnocytophaga cynodegmi]|uniref:DUF2750 domain-containing protein n=1 Tax=Capnocytophaga cynodegmi TaxID=28189 RepID=UPI0037D1F5C9